MLRKDPVLKAKFEEKLKDPKFAASASARLGFLFDNSPYRDRALNRYPVVKLTRGDLDRLGVK